MKKQSSKKIEKSMEFRKYYLSEFQLYDGEVYVTFNIVAINTNKNEITVAISNRGRISVTTYDLLTDGNGYFLSMALIMKKSIKENSIKEKKTMKNYFRITAYHKKLNISMIMDSYGKFNELWEFSAYFVAKDFNILEVHKADKSTDGNFQKAEQDTDHVILRADQYGMPDIQNNGDKTVTIANRYYSINN